MNLILSIFPGIDLLGRGFEAEGFSVVRGPDLLWGGDIETFHVPCGRFDGVIGGSPCADFSSARRDPPSGHSLRMLTEFCRVVEEAQPSWFLLENVPRVPDIAVPGYHVQRFDLNARECGAAQSRLRHFQFGSRDSQVLVIPRGVPAVAESQPICLAREGERKNRRSFADFCELQGLPRGFTLPGLSIAAKYAAVGNGVPIPVARVIAQAILAAAPSHSVRLCICNCGRVVTGWQVSATPACRKRLERRRKQPRLTVTGPGSATSADAHFHDAALPAPLATSGDGGSPGNLEHRALGFRVMGEMCHESRFSDELRALLAGEAPVGG